MDSHVVASRRPEKDYVLPPLDEAEGVEALDLVAFDTRLEAEVEVGERLHGREPGGPHGGLEPALIAKRDVAAEKAIRVVARARRRRWRRLPSPDPPSFFLPLNVDR